MGGGIPSNDTGAGRPRRNTTKIGAPGGSRTRPPQDHASEEPPAPPGIARALQAGLKGRQSEEAKVTAYEHRRAGSGALGVHPLLGSRGLSARVLQAMARPGRRWVRGEASDGLKRLAPTGIAS